MSQTVLALYDDFSTARQAVEALVDAGFDRDHISLIANDATGEYAQFLEGDDNVTAGEGAGFGAVVGTLVGLGVALIPGVGPVLAAGPFAAAALAGLGAAAGAVTGGIVGGLVDMGVPEEEAGYYAEGLRRGGVLVTVNADDTSVTRAQEIMNRFNPIDLENRSNAWREAGWTSYNAEAQPYTNDQITTERGLYNTVDTEGQQRFDIVEEELQVGKREVERGGVRVRSYVTTRPVEEQISLRDERVQVERRPVDRPATGSEFAAFKEGVIEVTEHHEEAVVSKNARVIEEVVIGKSVEEHTETIRDNVRRTDVEVENLGSTSTRYQPVTYYETSWRSDYDTNYANSGYGYEEYAPAYRYGYSLATNDQYGSWDWQRLEPEARRRWEERNPSTWDRFKNAIQRAWNDVRS
jgi:uncharacterized protein (TIGR02271 family)